MSKENCLVVEEIFEEFDENSEANFAILLKLVEKKWKIVL